MTLNPKNVKELNHLPGNAIFWMQCDSVIVDGKVLKSRSHIIEIDTQKGRYILKEKERDG